MTEQGKMTEQRTMTEQEINGGAGDDNREGKTMMEQAIDDSRIEHFRVVDHPRLK